jgi:DNA-binding NarL/FixJ family response regulator
MKGLTQREVAAQLGLSERTVETHVRNGVARCLTYLREHGFEEGQAR